MNEVSEEMLMALADGELDGPTADALWRQVEGDADLRRRLTAFGRARLLSKASFADVMDENVPARLLAFAEVKKRSWRPRHGLALAWLPLGVAFAALMLGFGIATLLDRGATSALPNMAALEAALNGQLAGGPAPAGQVAISGSYLVTDGVCRSFEADGGAGQGSWRGVACRREGGPWTLNLAVAVNGDSFNFQPASSQAGEAIDGFLDAAGAGAALERDEEQALRANDWVGRN